jgi:hypothetical protein
MAKGNIPCRKVCRSDESGHQQGAFCGYAETVAECTTLCANITCAEDRPTGLAGTSSRKMRKATGTSFQRRRKGGTGQPAVWKNAGGQIFGLTTQQALIAVGVGIAAYFIIKQVK